ncbi:transketolase [Lacticaseibacillus zeae]|uniref:Transketolase n=1 Tax=Lacticaseibacillus zeae subsp. silagei TaxID=3068307 RepID=A0ABD7Z6Z7_LACZE|nr:MULTISPECIES: transketolase [Lacticaseibacillus]MDE3315766.1 transketolase [Lacticaseibacillus zeae]OFR91594.1 transketolase [Lactobacillus sp. HMSC068F07]WLV82818.1 transketolase [Lacticaseibacillus sp. NCIMB 15475]WLV85559.1 transketolase [Lacticaseibacillus sp. NCIMB 15474]
MKNLDKLTINTMRTLTVDAVQHAHHGHMGMPLGTAPMGYALWRYFLKVNPKDPEWFNRDRFVLSAGHGSMLLYSLMLLSGFPLTMADIKQFRQLNSKTPGHPEVHKTRGVDLSTGPLGQGFAMAVGLAIAEAHLADRFNRPNFPVIDHYTYVVSGDGDFEEGISQETASLAGQLGLNKLIVLWDANHVTSDGPLTASNTEDGLARFRAMNWNTLEVKDGNDLHEINLAIAAAKRSANKPTLIKVNTVIGYGSTMQGTPAIHSDPVSEQEADHMRAMFGFADKPAFYIPDEVTEGFKPMIERGQKDEASWKLLVAEYNKQYPEEAAELTDFIRGKLAVPDLNDLEIHGDMATRQASGKVLNAIYPKLPILVGGSADLGTSNKTTIMDQYFMSNRRYSGPNIYFGVREFGMATIANGITLHGGLRGYTGTFLVFSDYMRSAIRQAAIMETPTIFVFTHDSVQVGQDGPTHQPIEHLMSLRAMPNLIVFRGADQTEVKAAWDIALKNKTAPTAIILNRQPVPELSRTDMKKAEKGAYVLSDPKDGQTPTGIIIATGSELQLALDAQAQLADEGIAVRVVSMPSWELFEQQPDEYKESILPDEIQNRMSIELGATTGWQQYVGMHGVRMGYDHFGESAPAKDILRMIDFTADHARNLYVAAFGPAKVPL